MTKKSDDGVKIPKNLSEPDWGALGKTVYKRSYSRVKKDGSRETWPETVKRVVDGNCLGPDTKVLTKDDGYRSISDIIGEEVKVLSIDSSTPHKELYRESGSWVPTTFHSYGQQDLFKIKVRCRADRGGQDQLRYEYLYATGDHEWVVLSGSSSVRKKRVKTTDLEGRRVPTLYPPKPEKNLDYYSGILHGYVFGDGSYDSRYNYSEIYFYAHHEESIPDILKHFEKVGHISTFNRKKEKKVKRIGRLPAEWKDLPSENASRSYWYGFIVGLVAADGSVNKKGAVSICQSTGLDERREEIRDLIKYIRDRAQWVGFRTTLNLMRRNTSKGDGFEGLNNVTVGEIKLHRDTVDPDDLILSHHKHRFVNNPVKNKRQSYEVVNVEPAYNTEVYCTNIPESHQFVINRGMVTGNCDYVDSDHIEPYEKVKLFHLIHNFLFVPAGRHLWATGITSGSEFISNCHAIGYDPHRFHRHFTYTFLRLMEGGGTGSSYSNKYVRDYPSLPKSVNLHLVCSDNHKDYDKMESLLSDEYSPEWPGSFIVPDSREGWAEALGKMLKCYYNGEERAVFDLSHIRPSGSVIKTFGGTASGPAALAKMMTNVNALLNDHVGRVPDSELFLNIDHEIAKAVIAGGTRRSARMASKHWEDHDILDFINLKNDGKSHWTANFSVELDSKFWSSYNAGDEHAVNVMDAIVHGIRINGEPGVLNLTKMSEGEINPPFCSNPCGEITGTVDDEMDTKGLMACNLGSVNFDALSDDPHRLKEAIRLGTRFLLRATYADYPDDELDRVVKKERRIGLGMMGFHPFLLKHGCKYTEFPHNDKMKNMMRDFYDEAKEAAREYAFNLRIPEPIKRTTIAPTGSTSNLPGTTPGMQSIKYKYFIRRVRFTTLDEEKMKKVEKYREAGFNVIDNIPREEDTVIVEFPLAAPDMSEYDESLIETDGEIDIEEMMAVQAALQETWADNSISVTIQFDEDETSEERIKRALLGYGPRLKGVTLFPEVSNLDNAPMEEISKEEFMSYPEEIRQEANSAGKCVTGSCEFDPSKIKH